MKNLKKKPIFYIMLLGILAIVGTTFAYYYNEVVIPNRFKTSTYNVVIEEVFNNEFGTKEVTIANKEETNAPVVLRVNYNESWTKEVDGAYLTLSNKIGGKDVVKKNWTSAFTDDFVKGSDGWYYYKKVLNPQESVKILNSIELDIPVILGIEDPTTSTEELSLPSDNDYNNYNYELDFNYEAIQADSKAVKEIWDKVITISGNDVTWPS